MGVPGGGVDGDIHAAAGLMLKDECVLLKGIRPGEAKTTYGYRLPASWVIHAVGPRDQDEAVLEQAYWQSLLRASESQLRTLAIPAIGTGAFNYPKPAAAEVALSTIRRFLDTHPFSGSIDCIILCTRGNLTHYEACLPLYFPTS